MSFVEKFHEQLFKNAVQRFACLVNIKAIGNDFVQVWVAGRSALAGRGAEPYDLPVHLANLKAACDQECRFAWHYPPVFLLPAAAMALLTQQLFRVLERHLSR